MEAIYRGDLKPVETLDASEHPADVPDLTGVRRHDTDRGGLEASLQKLVADLDHGLGFGVIAFRLALGLLVAIDVEEGDREVLARPLKALRGRANRRRDAVVDFASVKQIVRELRDKMVG